MILLYHSYFSLTTILFIGSIFPLCSMITMKNTNMTDNLKEYLSYRITCIKFTLFHLGKFMVLLKLFCLSFIWKMPLFYHNYIFSCGLLIFCCQSVATLLLYWTLTRKLTILALCKFEFVKMYTILKPYAWNT